MFSTRLANYLPHESKVRPFDHETSRLKQCELEYSPWPTLKKAPSLAMDLTAHCSRLLIDGSFG